jgi:hypothetical protein
MTARTDPIAVRPLGFRRRSAGPKQGQAAAAREARTVPATTAPTNTAAT